MIRTKGTVDPESACLLTYSTIRAVLTPLGSERAPSQDAKGVKGGNGEGCCRCWLTLARVLFQLMMRSRTTTTTSIFTVFPLWNGSEASQTLKFVAQLGPWCS